MKFYRSDLIFLFLLLVLGGSLLVADASPPDIPVWPKPAGYSAGSDSIMIAAEFKFNVVGKTNSYLELSIKRYEALTFWNGPPTASASQASVSVHKLDIDMSSASEVLNLTTDETYYLSIHADGSSELKARTVFGIMRGLETFSQVVISRSGSYFVNTVPLVIRDQPRFAWRGLLVDSARHYLPVDAVLRTIDALSYSKMNVMHWHVIDAQSFPVESAAYPLLSKMGAYSDLAVYSASEIKSVVEYAAVRGVRVVPEFDVPGHAYCWGLGYPNITAKCPGYEHNVNNIPLNPAHEETFKVLSGFLREMNSLFIDPMIHTGGDEVVYGCWGEDPIVKAWMKRKGFTELNQIMQFFETRLTGILSGLAKPREPVYWQEVFTSDVAVAENSIFEAWKDRPTLGKIVKSGHRGILAAGNYLDRQSPRGVPHYLFEDTWQDFYTNEPTEGLDLSAAEEARIIGGEAAMWGENVDETVIDGRVWPRGCAVAERLWSTKATTDLKDATERLDDHRCRLVRRGIGAGPIRPGPPCPGQIS